MPTLYRWTDLEADKNNPQKQFETRRAPGNVSFLVDNLWEWKRPESFADRRKSTFASPSPDLAKAAGGAPKGQVYRVEIKSAGAKVCQIPQVDARFHRDVEVLPKLMTGALKALLRSEWINRPLVEKQNVASLWAPCLLKEEVEELFATVELASHRQKVWDAIEFWNDVRLVQPGEQLPFPDGEVFFQADEYHLHSHT